MLKDNHLFVKWVKLFNLESQQFDYNPDNGDSDSIEHTLYVCGVITEAIHDLFSNIVSRYLRLGAAKYNEGLYMRDANIKGIMSRHNVLKMSDACTVTENEKPVNTDSPGQPIHAKYKYQACVKMKVH